MALCVGDAHGKQQAVPLRKVGMRFRRGGILRRSGNRGRGKKKRAQQEEKYPASLPAIHRITPKPGSTTPEGWGTG